MKIGGMLMAALVLSSLVPVDAQQNPNVAAINRQMRKKFHGQSNNKEEFKFEQLKSPPDLPDFQFYQGNAKFLRGTSAPHAQGGTSYTMVFDCKEQPQRVFDFYNQTLSSNRWMVNNPSPGKLLTAQKGKNDVVIQTSSKTGAGVCDILVLYHVGATGR